jgi:hypothetical protein
VVQAYRDQFTVGRRSLLDLLNAQNTYYSVQILVETARSAISFAEYRIVSADGRLLVTLNQTPPEESDAKAMPSPASTRRFRQNRHTTPLSARRRRRSTATAGDISASSKAPV